MSNPALDHGLLVLLGMARGLGGVVARTRCWVYTRMLVRDLDLHGNLVTDAVLGALCLEYRLSIVSADSDFARFRELT